MKSLKNISFFCIMFVALLSCSEDDSTSTVPSESDNPPIVLVHGAWQASFVWNQVKTKLEEQGNPVVTVELLGHGQDTTPAPDITFQGYVNQVKAVIDSLNAPVVLIGHSLGGAIITQTASEVPQQIDKLVYVAGFIPASGQSVFDYSAMDTGSLIPQSLSFAADGSTAAIADPEVNIRKVFCEDCSDSAVQKLIDHLKPEPAAAPGMPLAYSRDSYNSIENKYYVFTSLDKAITYSFQQQMASEAGITHTYKIATGHSPFLSKSDELTAIIAEILSR